MACFTFYPCCVVVQADPLSRPMLGCQSGRILPSCSCNLPHAVMSLDSELRVPCTEYTAPSLNDQRRRCELSRPPPLRTFASTPLPFPHPFISYRLMSEKRVLHARHGLQGWPNQVQDRRRGVHSHHWHVPQGMLQIQPQNATASRAAGAPKH